ncbi:MAG: preprotein translocase subunit SecG [Patescibacteria group bacterium]
MINVIQIILGVLLGVAILLQRQGAGLSGAFGGEGEFHHSRRGAEKFLFTATVILSILFFGAAIVNVIF